MQDREAAIYAESGFVLCSFLSAFYKSLEHVDNALELFFSMENDNDGKIGNNDTQQSLEYK